MNKNQIIKEKTHIFSSISLFLPTIHVFILSFTILFSGVFFQNVSAKTPKNTQNFIEVSESGLTEISGNLTGKHITLSQEYDAVGVEFPQNFPENSEIEISGDLGKNWTHLHASLDQKEDNIQKFSKLIFLPEISKNFIFRVTKNTGYNSKNQKFQFFFINTQDNTQNITASSSYSLPQSSYTRDDNFFLENGIIARPLWGADESLRYELGTVQPIPEINNPPTTKTIRCQQLQTLYPEEFKASRYVATENNKKLKWGYRYSPFIKKIVIHHTAENGAFAGDRTTEQIMQGIYKYHTLGRKWGDIGYNFVVAPDGKIFEGRAGGDFIAGGHVYCANVQTIGISLMGNFQEKQPTEKQIASLQRLLRGLSKKYNIDPTAEAMFHGKFTGNVVGHRDYGQTACPGKNLYSLISAIRHNVDLSGLAFQAQKLVKRSAKFLSKISLKTLTAGEKSHYTLQFKNTGKGVWNSETWLFADLPGTDIAIAPVDGKSIFYAAKLQEHSVKPNEIGTFQVDIIAGFENGLHTVEFSPVVDSRRIKSASVVIPVQVENAEIKIQFQKFLTTVLPNKKSLSVSIEILNQGNSEFLQNDTLLRIQLENTVRFLKMKERKVGKNQVAHFTGTIPVVGYKNEKLFSAILSNRNGIIPGAQKKTKIVKIIPNKEIAKKSEISPMKKNWQAEISGLVRKKFQTSGIKGAVPQKYFSVINTGNTIWKKKDIQLVAVRKGERHIIYMQENSVSPGKTATFYLKGKTKMTSHQVFRLQLRYKKGYKIIKFKNTKFRWIVLPTTENRFTKKEESQVNNPSQKTSSRNQVQKNKKKNIRIKLGYPQGNTIEFSGNFDIMIDGKKIMKNQKKFSLTQDFSGNNLLWGNGFSGKIFRIIPSSSKASEDTITRISSWKRTPSWDASGQLNDNQFRGIIEARVFNGKLTIINELPLEEYLLGLAEVSNSAHPEKQKTMAVIARSYAQYYMSPEHNKYPQLSNPPYDGDDSPNSFQKYLGYGYEKRSPQFSQAVKNTAGITVQYNGKTVKTPFFSRSNGRTLSAQEKWGWKNTPYLISVDDSFCANKTNNTSIGGHGVGLSGCGADALAEQGKKYPEILQYYYTGVSIGK